MAGAGGGGAGGGRAGGGAMSEGERLAGGEEGEEEDREEVSRRARVQTLSGCQEGVRLSVVVSSSVGRGAVGAAGLDRPWHI